MKHLGGRQERSRLAERSVSAGEGVLEPRHRRCNSPEQASTTAGGVVRGRVVPPWQAVWNGGLPEGDDQRQAREEGRIGEPGACTGPGHRGPLCRSMAVSEGKKSSNEVL